MRVCVTGGREEKDQAYVWDYLYRFEAEFGEITELGQGEALGVDRFAKEWAEHEGIPTRDYAADWDRYGDAAGAIRNGEMLEDFKPDVLIVFRGNSGTQNCARQARKMGIEREIVDKDVDPFEDALRWG